MGNMLNQWRAAVGGFCQPVKCKTRFKTLQIRYHCFMSLGLRTLLLVLLVAQGVEPNPGPPGGSFAGRGNRGSARGVGAPRGRGSADYFADYSDSEGRNTGRGRGSGGGLRCSQRIQDRPTSNRPSLLSAWLTTSQPQLGHASTMNPDNRVSSSPFSDTHSDNDSETEMDPLDSGTPDPNTNTSQTQILLEIRKDVKQMNKKFDKLDRKVKELRNDNKQLKQQNENLSKQVNKLITTVICLENRMNEAEKKNEHLEAQSRRDNLKFYGIEEDADETWKQSETKIRNYLTDELNVEEHDVKIERAHRLPSKFSPRPIIVKFSYFKDKDAILRAYRNKRKDTQTDASNDQNEHGDNTNGERETTRLVRVSKDFPLRVTKAHTQLYPFLKSCLGNDMAAYLRYDTLVVDGQHYVYDEDRGRPVPYK